MGRYIGHGDDPIPPALAFVLVTLRRCRAQETLGVKSGEVRYPSKRKKEIKGMYMVMAFFNQSHPPIAYISAIPSEMPMS